MAESEQEQDSIPTHFRSIEEAAEFWGSHDLSGYWDATTEAHFEIDLQSQVFLTALEPELAKKLTKLAQKRGISTETLINLQKS